MGTRSTTKIYEDGKLVLAIYKQFDGYVKDGWGDELKKFIKSGLHVNGLPGCALEKKCEQRYFNGITDFALQLVAKYKDRAGDLYATTADDKQEYNYSIDYDTTHNYLFVECKEEPSYDEDYIIGKDGHVISMSEESTQSKPIVKNIGGNFEIDLSKVPSQNPKGWHKEPINHALASKGIKVGKNREKR
jgi:hypothetical protein